MPPTGSNRSARPNAETPFICLWVEEDVARLWRVDPSGPIDEVARFAIENMARTTVLEIAAQFVKAIPTPTRPINAVMSVEPRDAETVTTPYRGKGRPRKTDAPPKRRDKAHGKSRYVPRGEQIARQEELWQALLRHGDEGVSAKVLAEELGRGVTSRAAVPLGVLQRQGKAIKVDDLWYPITNGNIPRHA